MRYPRITYALLGLLAVLGIVLILIFCLPRKSSHVPSDEFRHTATLGLMLNETEDQVIVLGVMDDSPAEDLGLLPGDVLITFGKDRIQKIDQFNALLAEADPARWELQVRRGNETISFLAAQP